MNYEFKVLDKHIAAVHDWLRKEIGVIRTGRASPVLVERLTVDYHGEKLSLQQLAAIHVEDARTLRIQPWDPASVGAVEQALSASEIGAQPIVDKETIRVVLPELTEERRNRLTKLVNEKLEEARRTLRSRRDEVWYDIQERARNGELTEDDKYLLKEKLEGRIKHASAELEEAARRKEAELRL